MSRLAKKPILLPEGVEVKTDGDLLLIKGAKGELKKILDTRVTVEISEGKVWVKPKNESILADKDFSPVWGLYRSLVANMIAGVNKGFEKALTFQGVGFKASVKGPALGERGSTPEGGRQDLELSLGFTNPVVVSAPAGISFRVEKNRITVSGTDKELVGQIAAKIREQRKPEPYQLSGIKYEDEVIIKKAGKKAITTTG